MGSPKGNQLSRDQGDSTGTTDSGFGEEGKVGLDRDKHGFLTDKLLSKCAGMVINSSDNWLCQEQMLRASVVSELARADSASHYTLEQLDINVL